MPCRAERMPRCRARTHPPWIGPSSATLLSSTAVANGTRITASCASRVKLRVNRCSRYWRCQRHHCLQLAVQQSLRQALLWSYYVNPPHRSDCPLSARSGYKVLSFDGRQLAGSRRSCSFPMLVLGKSESNEEAVPPAAVLSTWVSVGSPLRNMFSVLSLEKSAVAKRLTTYKENIYGTPRVHH